MTITELKQHFFSELQPSYPSEEVQSFFSILSEEILKKTRLELALEPDATISVLEQEQFETAVIRLKAQEPIQYIIGRTDFFGLSFTLNSHTLIPRPETEELVAWILELQKNRTEETVSVLDLGTGSGCIAVTLAKYLPQAQVDAMDISEGALEIAKENAAYHDVSVTFRHQDIFSIGELPQPYDLIVSNPPYVRELEKEHMQPNVLQFEPEAALFVPNDNPLRFYQKIAQLAKKGLRDQGVLYFEINEYLSNDMRQMLNNEGFAQVVIKQDMFGKDRMIKATIHAND
ncbi:peptide chain release factor N(5)-glutamine methyltransferase [Altibacter sp.]|uniref:peptide chain release factor N(5)-glutamine methyltransferase n=1 Tax=Altibacter sp. TaxID=2024823 RepID=UPI000C954DDD|nr:peptide chain release factor N(5)-glutamine methyltransferase [Altibacter sp.]MAP53853.1 protein-(glutamine-N5) methyltransferase, release factor-specific [Altibacter sp.]